MVRRLVQVVIRLAAALVIGVATVVLPKRRPDDHWSTPPTWAVESVDHEEPGGGGDPLPHGAQRALRSRSRPRA